MGFRLVWLLGHEGLNGGGWMQSSASTVWGLIELLGWLDAGLPAVEHPPDIHRGQLALHWLRTSRKASRQHTGYRQA